MDCCLVFDLDDTLYLERDYVRSGFESVGVWVRRWLGVDGFGRRCWERFEAGQRTHVFDETLAELAPGAEAATAELVSVYRAHTPRISLTSDAEAFLNRISPSHRTALITDGPALVQSRKIEVLRLERFIPHMILTDLWGTAYRKPHTRAFESVQALAGGTHFVYIGDNPAKDFAAPKRLGWTTVRVRRSGGLHAAKPSMSGAIPDIELASLEEIDPTRLF